MPGQQKQLRIPGSARSLASWLMLLCLCQCSADQGTSCLPNETNNQCRARSTTSKGGTSGGTSESNDSAITITVSAIGPHSAQLSWQAANDAVTPQEELFYRVIYAGQAAAIVANADPASVSFANDWTQNGLAANLTGLDASSEYFLGVLLRNNAGEITLRGSTNFVTADLAGPTTGTAISFSDVANTSLKVNWGAASHPETTSANLQYRLVRASLAESIDSSAEISANSNGSMTIVNDWSNFLSTSSVTGLSASTVYYFAVAVKTPSGLFAVYSPARVTTADPNTPVAGSSLSFSNIASTSLTMNWTSATHASTPGAELQYRVVRALDPSLIDTSAEISGNLAAGVTEAVGWTSNLSSYSATGLADGQTYYFAVIVKANDGGTAVYGPSSVTTVDVSAPTIGTGLVATQLGSQSVTINWGSASDNKTSVANLKYKLVKAAASSAIDTIAEVDAIAGGDLIVDLSPNKTSQTLTGLTYGGSYSFNVLVEDEAGKQSIYAPIAITVIDDSTPVVGEITLSQVTESSMQVSWTAASDPNPNHSQALLEYKLVMSESASAIDTAAEADAITSGSGLKRAYSTSGTTALSFTATGLNEGTNYSFAVLVKDPAGNLAYYPAKTQLTVKKLFIFITAGSWNGDLGGVNGADLKCNSDGDRPDSSVSYKALLASNSRIACTSNNCSAGGVTEHLQWVLAPNRVYKTRIGINSPGISSTVNSTDSNGLLIFNLLSVITKDNYVVWTGLTGDYENTPANCDDWSSSNGATSGGSGNSSTKFPNLLEGGTTACSSPSHLICVEQP